ncbi:MAG: Isochorismate synthase MenF [Chlamydiae bacterium]|nr:Isochorismate synthase MenF [Chlamydiota bacterium]
MLEEVQTSEFLINESRYLICCVTKSINPLDLFAQLSFSHLLPKVYWKYRTSTSAIAGFGKVIELNDIPSITLTKALKGAPLSPSFFGGQSFNPLDAPWQNTLPNTYYFLPRYLIKQEGNHFFLSTFSLQGEVVEPFHISTSKRYKENNFKTISREDSPNLTNWMQRIEGVLKNLKKDSLKKIVPARETSLILNQTINPYSLLAHLSEIQKNCSLFSFQLSEKTFLGATPETLFERKGDTLFTEAIAGTSTSNELSLIKNPKNLDEFSHVTHYLDDVLNKICDSFEKEPLHLISTSNLNHLKVSYRALLKKNVSDCDILKRLHPTPAVCGTPKSQALKELLTLDPFNRGWYAAPMGQVSNLQSHFLVGIRSALVHNNELKCFAGCGIVKASDPIDEWNELEHKISPYLKFVDCYAQLQSSR